MIGIMPITLTATAATEIPEQFRTNAKEVDGRFVVDGLDPSSIVPGAEAAALRGKLTKAEQDLKRRDERLRTFAKDDAGTLYEPDEFKGLLDEYRALKEAQGKQPNADDLRKQIVAEAEGRYQRKLTEAEKRAIENEKRAAELDRELDRTTLESVLSSLLAEMRPKEGKAELARLLLREKLDIDKASGRTVRVRTPDGKDWMTGAGPDGYATPKDFALGVLRTQYADLFQGDGESGAGASNTSGAGRKHKYSFPASQLNGKANEFYALQERAKKEGQTVYIDQNA